MSILIKGVEMPKNEELLSINIYPNGKVTIAMDLKCKQIATAMQVVHCKECMHNPEHSIDEICPFVDTDGYVREIPNDDFFCKYGERREND